MLRVPVHGQIFSNLHYFFGILLFYCAYGCCSVDETMHHSSLNVRRMVGIKMKVAAGVYVGFL
jgi:hypothetical protein